MTILDIIADPDSPCARLKAGFEQKCCVEVTVCDKPGWMGWPDHTTTLWSTVYWSKSRKYTGATDRRALATLAHELVHVAQFRSHPVIMPILYLMPQILTPLCLLGLVWAPLWLIALCALPWPAYWRARYEAEGYALTCRVLDIVPQRAVGPFVSASYYWMWPFPRHVARMISSRMSDDSPVAQCLD